MVLTSLHLLLLTLLSVTVGYTATATVSGRQGGLRASCEQGSSGNLPWGAIPTRYALPSRAP